MKTAITAMAISAVAVASCVDSNYDINRLDKSVCILPGIEIPLGKLVVMNLSLDSFLGIPANTAKTDDGTILLKGSISGNGTAVLTGSQLGSGEEISIQTELVTTFDKTNAFFSAKGVGKALANPSIVMEFSNPSDKVVTLTAEITDGKTSGSFSADIPAGKHNIYISASGSSSHLKGDVGYVDVQCNAMTAFFNPEIPPTITVRNIRLKSVITQSMTMGGSDCTFIFTAQGLIGMTINPGAEFEYLTDIEIEEENSFLSSSYVFKAGDEIKLESRIEKVGIAFDIIPTIADHTDEVKFSFSPATLLSSDDSLNLFIEGGMLKDMALPKKSKVKVIIRNPGRSPISVTGNESIRFTLISLTSTSGIQF